jgi:uncharacterized protein YbjT (DUF2867 family)
MTSDIYLPEENLRIQFIKERTGTMKVLLFGATGMIGQGALREALLDPEVTEVATFGRAKTGKEHPKLREIVHGDLMNLAPVKEQLKGFDTCFFCLGISSAGLSEAEYRTITFDYAMSVAKTLVELNPSMVFIFISGAGADSTGKSRTMWARVKGETENAILALPFRDAYVLRPAAVQPLHGITSRTRSYRIMYAIAWPLFWLFRAVAPKYVTTTEIIGKALLHVAKKGAPKKLLESPDAYAVVSSQ